MRYALSLALLTLTTPALGQSGFEMLEGSFGSANDPAATCAANPHRLSIIDDRPHLARIWEQPYAGPTGAARLREVYDVNGIDAMALTLSQDGPFHDTSDGKGNTWVMQFTQNPAGYCWRRPDWPETQCQDQQLRCDAPIS